MRFYGYLNNGKGEPILKLPKNGMYIYGFSEALLGIPWGVTNGLTTWTHTLINNYPARMNAAKIQVHIFSQLRLVAQYGGTCSIPQPYTKKELNKIQLPSMAMWWKEAKVRLQSPSSSKRTKCAKTHASTPSHSTLHAIALLLWPVHQSDRAPDQIKR